jgi:hypothetical protein
MTTMHFPVNHHLRPLYRALAGLTGIYMLVFGIVAFSKTSGMAAFAQDQGVWALGLRANPAFAILSIAAGVIVVLANVVGRNLAHHINQLAGIVLALVAMASLLVLQTDANYLDFSMVNVVVTFIMASIIGTASLYDRVGSAEDAHAEEAVRHSH